MTTLDRAADLLPSRYRIERQLGRGSVATVLLAEDLERGEYVAVKVLKPELAGGIVADRFHREIRILSDLNHPGILSVFDSGQSGTLMYFTMPFADGGTLRDRMDDRGTFALAEVAALLRVVSGAIDHAHGQGVIHRDIKPENVVFRGDQPLMCDFGVARAVIRAAGDTISTSGLVVGTPSYMSPEQARGEDDIDHRTDLYGLGCLIFELLAGSPPFTGRTVQSIMARQVADPPPPLRSRRDDVPDAVDTVLATCLDKDRRARPASAAEISRLFDSALGR
jgi:serine/threonine-protein kinase